jgi:DNA topoisomerase-1
MSTGADAAFPVNAAAKGFDTWGPTERIRRLVIPPTWENVWICPSANGHIEAVGWDARGRKQYRYHEGYRAVRDEAKFSRMIAFCTVLAKIRRRVDEDLARRGLPRDKVLAAVVRPSETTCIRVGNDEYARENDSFGLTTLRNRHVRIEGSTLMFRFRGKSGQEHSIALTDSSTSTKRARSAESIRPT